MNVSFGSLNQHCELTPNTRQVQVLYKIGERLDPDSIEELRYESKGGNLTNLLKDKKDADIDVVLKRNGLIDISVIREAEWTHPYRNENFSFVPYSVTGYGKIKTTINPMSKNSVIKKNLEDFADKCYWYAKTAQSRRNSLLENELESKIENALAKMPK